MRRIIITDINPVFTTKEFVTQKLTEIMTKNMTEELTNKDLANVSALAQFEEICQKMELMNDVPVEATKEFIQRLNLTLDQAKQLPIEILMLKLKSGTQNERIQNLLEIIGIQESQIKKLIEKSV